jgi:hypothetical protein
LPLALASAFILGSESRGTRDHIYCLGFETSLFVASHDSLGYRGGIRPHRHTGIYNQMNELNSPFITSRRTEYRSPCQTVHLLLRLFVAVGMCLPNRCLVKDYSASIRFRGNVCQFRGEPLSVNGPLRLSGLMSLNGHAKKYWYSKSTTATKHREPLNISLRTFLYWVLQMHSIMGIILKDASITLNFGGGGV